MNAEGETKTEPSGVTIDLHVGVPTDEAVSANFFSAAVKLLRRQRGDRLVDQAAINSLIEHLAKVEALWLSLTAVPCKAAKGRRKRPGSAVEPATGS